MGLPAAIVVQPFPRVKIEQQIRDWWAAEEQALRDAGDPFRDLTSSGDTVFEILPAIPSHQAVEVTVLLEQTIGREIPETVIRRGGYHSADDFVGDLLQKLEALHNAG